MPTKAKLTENMTKNLTAAERAAREAAEAAVVPRREAVNLEPPRNIASGNAGALKYWETILARLDGLELLDDLDTEVLALYCDMLARRDQTRALFKRLTKRSKSRDISTAELLEITDELGALNRQLQSHERLILQYADRLGLTPASRAGLARKKAEPEDDPYADLFG